MPYQHQRSPEKNAGNYAHIWGQGGNLPGPVILRASLGNGIQSKVAQRAMWASVSMGKKKEGQDAQTKEL